MNKISRTIRIKVYKFAGLSKEVQREVLEEYRYCHVHSKWWDYVYEDANNIGLKIIGFDIERENFCEGEFTLSACEVVANIFRDHGEDCGTYKTADKFMNKWQPIFYEYMDEESEKYESSESEIELMELEDNFLKSILEGYHIMLSNEYKHLTSDEFIENMFEDNEYEFYEGGTLYTQ